MISSIKNKSIVLAFLFLSVLSFQSFAQLDIQSVQIGAKAGGNFYKIGGRSFDGKLYSSFSAGAYAELNFTSKWSLQPELLYSEVIAQTSEQFNQIYPRAVSSRLYQNYVTLPILVSFKPVPELSLLLGPQVGYLAAQTSDVYNGNGVFSKFDVGLIFGAQLNLGKMKIGARYYAGFNNVNGINSSDDWRVHGLQAYVGYQLWSKTIKK